MITPEQLWADFNGHNHAELAARHGLSLQQVYDLLSQYHRSLTRSNLIMAVDEVVAAPEHYQALPSSLRIAAVRAVHDQAGRDAAERLLSLCSDAQPVAAVASAGRPGNQTATPVKPSLVHQVALRVSGFVRSLFIFH